MPRTHWWSSRGCWATDTNPRLRDRVKPSAWRSARLACSTVRTQHSRRAGRGLRRGGPIRPSRRDGSRSASALPASASQSELARRPSTARIWHGGPSRPLRSEASSTAEPVLRCGTRIYRERQNEAPGAAEGAARGAGSRATERCGAEPQLARGFATRARRAPPASAPISGFPAQDGCLR
jgi:hypothetical protein